MKLGHSRSKITTLVAAASILVLAACSDDGSSADAGSAGGDEGELSQFSVSMPVIPPNFVHTMPWVAQDQGFYEDFGLEVELITLDSGVTSLRGAEAGSADVGTPPTPTLINAVAQGSSVKAFYTYSPRLEVQLLVTPEIESCEDLGGNVVGVDEVGGFAEVLTKMVYQSCGLTQDDVTYGNFPGAEGQAMAQGQAVSGVLHIDEAAGVIAQFPDSGLYPLVDLWNEVPQWHYAGFATTDEIIEEKRDEIVAFVAANIAANEFMRETGNKDAVLDTAEEVTGLTRDILSETYDIFIAEGLWEYDNGYPQDMVEYTIDQQVELGNITDDQRPSYEDLVDPTIYEDALALFESRS